MLHRVFFLLHRAKEILYKEKRKKVMPQSKSINGGLGHQNHNHFYVSEPLNVVISAEGFKVIQMVINHHEFHPFLPTKLYMSAWG